MNYILMKNSKEIFRKYKGGGRDKGEESVSPTQNKIVQKLKDELVENSGESRNKSQSI